jgi:sugar-specific transcriptional regulator TrmB
MDTEIFEDLGLTKTEIKIYLTLLELGSSSAGKILENSKLQILPSIVI